MWGYSSHLRAAQSEAQTATTKNSTEKMPAVVREKKDLSNRNENWWSWECFQCRTYDHWTQRKNAQAAADRHNEKYHTPLTKSANKR